MAVSFNNLHYFLIDGVLQRDGATPGIKKLLYRFAIMLQYQAHPFMDRGAGTPWITLGERFDSAAGNADDLSFLLDTEFAAK
jgi:hypothetical protein